jgi:hypothetical protein
MTEYYIVLPNQIFYKKDVFDKMINSNIKEIIIVEDIKYFTPYVSWHLSVLKCYADTLKKLIKKLKLSIKVKIVQSLIGYLNKKNVTGKTFMHRPTINDPIIYNYKPGGLLIEFYSSPNYILSISSQIKTKTEFHAKIKHTIRTFNTNNMMLCKKTHNYTRYGKSRYAKYKTLCVDNPIDLPVDSFNAMKKIDEFIAEKNNVTDLGIINIYLNVGMITPDDLISLLKTKHSKYSQNIIDLLIKRDENFFIVRK